MMHLKMAAVVTTLLCFNRNNLSGMQYKQIEEFLTGIGNMVYLRNEQKKTHRYIIFLFFLRCSSYKKQSYKKTKLSNHAAIFV